MWPCNQSLETLAFLWEKLSKRQFYKDLIRKTTEVQSWIKFNNLGLAMGMTLKCNTREVITKSHKVLEATVYVCRRNIWWGGGGGFATTIMFKKIRLTTILPIHVYIIRINNRLLLKIKDGYKLELLTPETMMLFGSSKKINRWNKKQGKITKSRSSWSRPSAK